jgi:hypothetical protein
MIAGAASDPVQLLPGREAFLRWPEEVEDGFLRSQSKRDVEKDLACSDPPVFARAYGVDEQANGLIAGSRQPKRLRDLPERAVHVGDRQAPVVEDAQRID